jgi:hypothetical protein
LANYSFFFIFKVRARRQIIEQFELGYAAVGHSQDAEFDLDILENESTQPPDSPPEKRQKTSGGFFSQKSCKEHFRLAILPFLQAFFGFENRYMYMLCFFFVLCFFLNKVKFLFLFFNKSPKPGRAPDKIRSPSPKPDHTKPEPGNSARSPSPINPTYKTKKK